MKHSFSSLYEVFLKITESKAVFTQIKMNDEWNIDFLKPSCRMFYDFHIFKSYC